MKNISVQLLDVLYCSNQGSKVTALEESLGKLLGALLVNDRNFDFNKLYSLVRRIICATHEDRVKILKSALNDWFNKRYDRIAYSEYEKERLMTDIKTMFKGAQCIEDVGKIFLRKISPEDKCGKDEVKRSAKIDHFEQGYVRITSVDLPVSGLNGKRFGSAKMFRKGLNREALRFQSETAISKDDIDLRHLVSAGLISPSQKRKLQEKFTHCATPDSKTSELVNALRLNYGERITSLYDEGSIDHEKLRKLISFIKDNLIGSSYIAKAREIILSDIKGMAEVPDDYDEGSKQRVYYAGNDFLPEAEVQIKIVPMPKEESNPKLKLAYKD